ncbi:hypothetical protein QBC41DRAFT_329041 [Cercophora samala]|uniref:Uncharacterized protein n=1 Tax=Cercophora samala TaxID=330535 RepID=A0AA39Z5A4_9PEZI|nr:hypothetical protein QBC41DRAFT_329041 [Cercophora samala]
MPATYISRGGLTAIQRIVSNRSASPASARSLSGLTMGFDEIKKWKEWKTKQIIAPDPKDTIFDLKVYSPINKSSTWNIDYSETPTRPPSPPPHPGALPLEPSYPTRFPLPPRVAIRSLRFPGNVLFYKPGSRRGGGPSSPPRAVFSTTTQHVTLETFKSVDKGGKVGSQTARLKNSVRNRVMSGPKKDAQQPNNNEKKDNKTDGTEQPVPRFLPSFLGGGGPF